MLFSWAGRLDLTLFLIKLVDKYQRKILWKNVFEQFTKHYAFSVPVASFLTLVHFLKECAKVYDLSVILSFLNFFGRTSSPDECSRGSPGRWITFFFTKLVD